MDDEFNVQSTGVPDGTSNFFRSTNELDVNSRQLEYYSDDELESYWNQAYDSHLEELNFDVD